jgi:hypothetical protein
MASAVTIFAFQGRAASSSGLNAVISLLFLVHLPLADDHFLVLQESRHQVSLLPVRSGGAA